jgi:hypothetical protein
LGGSDPHVPCATRVLVWAGSTRDSAMPPTPLRKLYRSVGTNIQDDKSACKTLLHDPELLAKMFRESVAVTDAFDGTKQPFLTNASLKIRKTLGPQSRGDNRIVYLMSTKDQIAVEDGPPAYSFQFVRHQVPPLRLEGAGQPRSGAGGVDYVAIADGTPVLGEIKLTGDKNAFSAFIQLLTYLSEFATEKQVQRANKYKEFNASLEYPQAFDMHILLVDVNRRRAATALIEQTKELAASFRGSLHKDDKKVVGKILCLQMDSESFSSDAAATVACLWQA